MARQRFIWPDLWADPGFASLTPLEQVLYIGCFSNADDEGRLEGDPAVIRAKVFPTNAFRTRKLVLALEHILAAMPKLVRYEVNGVQYLQFTNWREWQKPKYPSPSRLPCPPWDSGNVSGSDSLTGSGNDSSVGWVGLGYTPLPPSERTPSPPGTAGAAAPAEPTQRKTRKSRKKRTAFDLAADRIRNIGHELPPSDLGAELHSLLRDRYGELTDHDLEHLAHQHADMLLELAAASPDADIPF